MFLSAAVHITTTDIIVVLVVIGFAIFGAIFGRNREQMQEENKHNHK